MNLATVLTLITLALAAALAALVALRWWMAQPDRVLAEIDALDLPADTKAAIRADCAAAQKADQRTWWYDLSAPLVMLLVLPFGPRSADRLPRLMRATKSAGRVTCRARTRRRATSGPTRTATASSACSTGSSSSAASPRASTRPQNPSPLSWP